MALGRLEVGATTGGIKVSGFLLKRGMLGGDKMVVYFKFPAEQPREVNDVAESSLHIGQPSR